ncbi:MULTISPECIES: imidazole glycerol phosphate synthase subunit HisH [Olsenella]|uniref:imidazole glycerol phosphate synthase subunit HisH n=1 Tax=Olsenella TaxID=133925 RepID=UPI00071D8453|nr:MULTISPECIES: imidazole glycerol phosphate synthase subunit HisH [Olsenella]OFK24768.1 imidazole glycerol phosphate synthase subunit HisH [Olsenella sp. HMSC062G07]
MAAGRIVVVDYHRGNLQSVVRGLEAAGGLVTVTDDPTLIAGAAGVVLPGVGAFEDAMGFIRQGGQADAIMAALGEGTPFLGICLGLHLLFDRGSERSSEGGPSPWGGTWVPGLGVLSGSVTRLPSGRLKVPHVGWDQIHLTDVGQRCPLLVDVPEGGNVYFTHSFAVDEGVDGTLVAARTHYARSFASCVWRDNVFGVQFHPEKSSAAGLRILSNFVRIVRG